MERNHDNSRVPPDAIGEVDGGYVTTHERLVSGTKYAHAVEKDNFMRGSAEGSRFLVWVPVDPPVMVTIEADLLERLVNDALELDYFATPTATVKDRTATRRAIRAARAKAAGR
jgi:hypothetical protein